MGNHDYFAVRCHLINDSEWSESFWSKKRNGGKWWFSLTSYEKDIIAEELSKLPHMIEIKTKNKRVGIVHANIPFDLSWEQTKLKVQHSNEIKKYIRENRDRARQTRKIIIDDIDKVYFGHCSFTEIKNNGNCTFIDTGSGYEVNLNTFFKGGKLSIEKIN
jgi:serine/threonine protein phosphatase 1